MCCFFCKNLCALHTTPTNLSEANKGHNKVILRVAVHENVLYRAVFCLVNREMMVYTSYEYSADGPTRRSSPTKSERGKPVIAEMRSSPR